MSEVLAISAAEYHADPCERPSLSSSLIHVLLSQSPLHAWAAHPRLNPDYAPRESETFDLGRAAHALMLEGPEALCVIDANSWRTAEAREARDEARAAGRVPLLTGQMANVEAMVAAARSQFAAMAPAPFASGKAEQTIIWEEQGVLCRARLDWIDESGDISDYKTTSKSAQPQAWNRALFGNGGDVQAALYMRAVRAALGVETPDFRWVVQETYPPYALSIVVPGADLLTIAEKKIDYALALWRRCLDDDLWPGYPSPSLAYLPPYEEARWLEREELEAA